MAATIQEKRYIIEQRARGVSYVQIAKKLQRTPNSVRMIFERTAGDDLSEKAGSVTTTGICKQCGKEFIQMAKGTKRLFCSDSCRYAWYNSKKRRTPHHLVCEHCGREFVAFGNPHKRFCSRQCFADSQKEAQHEEA